MNNMADKIVKNIIIFEKNNNNDFDEALTESYLNLSFAAIEFYFKDRLFLIKSGKNTKEMHYNYDLYSLLKILDIQNEMLQHGINLFYSLHSISNDYKCEYWQVYKKFISESGIFEINEDKDSLVKELIKINNETKKYIIDYYNAQ